MSHHETYIRRTPSGYYEVGVMVKGDTVTWCWVKIDRARNLKQAKEGAPHAASSLLYQAATRFEERAAALNNSGAQLRREAFALRLKQRDLP